MQSVVSRLVHAKTALTKYVEIEHVLKCFNTPRALAAKDIVVETINKQDDSLNTVMMKNICKRQRWLEARRITGVNAYEIATAFNELKATKVLSKFPEIDEGLITGAFIGIQPVRLGLAGLTGVTGVTGVAGSAHLYNSNLVDYLDVDNDLKGFTSEKQQKAFARVEDYVYNNFTARTPTVFYNPEPVSDTTIEMYRHILHLQNALDRLILQDPQASQASQAERASQTERPEQASRAERVDMGNRVNAYEVVDQLIAYAQSGAKLKGIEYAGHFINGKLGTTINFGQSDKDCLDTNLGLELQPLYDRIMTRLDDHL